MFSHSWLVPATLVMLFNCLCDLGIHTHQVILIPKKILLSIHKIKFKSQSASTQQLAVISILYKLTMRRMYLFVAIFVQDSIMKSCG